MIQFFCPGTPAQQGSKRSVGNGRFIEVNPHLKSWRSVVASACPLEAPLDCPLCLAVEFRFVRPKGHFGSRKGQSYLKPTAPIYKPSAPDLDKLVRAIGDALKGIAFTDDALIARIEAVKVYTEGTAGALITITPLRSP